MHQARLPSCSSTLSIAEVLLREFQCMLQALPPAPTTLLTSCVPWPLPVFPLSCLLTLLLNSCQWSPPHPLCSISLCVHGCGLMSPGADIVVPPHCIWPSFCFHAPRWANLHHSVHLSTAFQPPSWSWKMLERCIWMKMISPVRIQCVFPFSLSLYATVPVKLTLFKGQKSPWWGSS